MSFLSQIFASAADKKEWRVVTANSGAEARKCPN